MADQSPHANDVDNNIQVLSSLNFVVVVPGFPDKKLRDTLVAVIKAIGGQVPVQKSDSESAMRVHYAPMSAKVIINTANKRMQEVIGKHSVVIALEVDDQVMAARQAAEMFVANGFPAFFHTHAEPEFPDGFLTFVQVDSLNGIALMFWPKAPQLTPEVVANLPKREPWTAEDLAGIASV